MRIVLIGFRGTGKTLVGTLLSRQLEIPFYDTDRIIEEKAGQPIEVIFESRGEESFRQMESAAIESLTGGDAVISTGGGVVLDPGNVASLKRDSVVFLLEADDDIVEERIAKSSRPSLTGLPLEEEIRKLQEQRRPAYTGAADYCISTNTVQADEICRIIRNILSEGTVSRNSRVSAISFLRDTGLDPGMLAELEDAVIGPCADPLTRIYGIVGNPCFHSKSPALYNHLFRHYRLNNYYTWFQWHRLHEIMECAEKLDVRGLSVTIPFKGEIIGYLDRVDTHVEAIGAANTVVFCGGSAYGYNTDWLGVRAPLEHRKNADAVVLGAGGAAAAAVYALLDLGMNVTILNRTPEKARTLAERMGCSYGPLDAFRDADPGVIVNATSVGMHPDPGTPVDPSLLRSDMTVYDLVYTPPDTPLIRYARQNGCETITGIEMFVRQACAQFRHFTGMEVPVRLVRECVMEE